jgi:hypothetical protein
MGSHTYFCGQIVFGNHGTTTSYTETKHHWKAAGKECPYDVAYQSRLPFNLGSCQQHHPQLQAQESGLQPVRQAAEPPRHPAILQLIHQSIWIEAD